MIFCTLFNWFYLPQGIALYRSLEATVTGGFELHVLCMDDFTEAALRKLAFPHLRIISLAAVEDDAMRAVRASRSIGEYCWTCTTPLLAFVMSGQPDGAVVMYVDADLRFFSDPAAVLSEMGSGSIFIHEHNFAPEHKNLQDASGRFNVGLVAFRKNIEGRACIEKWRAQCIDECVMDAEAGKCGDQNYLDDWPEQYPGLVISKNSGVGLAPWNVSKYDVRSSRGNVRVDDSPVVFYHFHSFRMLRPRFTMKPTTLASGSYRFDQNVVRELYQPYAREVWRASRQLDSAGFAITHALPTVPAVYSLTRNDQLMFQLMGRSFSVDQNVQVLKTLYGIDADREIL